MILLAAFALNSQAQEQEPQQDPMAYMVVKTFEMCNSCVEMLQNNLPFEKGIHKATVDTENNEILIDYNPKKTDKDKVRKAIAKMGVQADDVPADPEGVKEMPECCKNSGCGRPGAKKEMKEAPQAK